MVLSLIMPKTAATRILAKHFGKAAGALLVLAGITFMAGCQGLSVGSSSHQQQNTLSINVSTIDFGSVAAGSSKTLSATATNSGSSSITINSAAISAPCCTLASPSLPLTV